MSTYMKHANAIVTAIIAVDTASGSVVEVLAKQLAGFSALGVDSPVVKELADAVAAKYSEKRGADMDKAMKSHLRMAIVAVTNGYAQPEGERKSLSHYAQSFRNHAAKVFKDTGNSIAGYVPKLATANKKKATKAGKVEKTVMPKSKPARVKMLLTLLAEFEIVLNKTQSAKVTA